MAAGLDSPIQAWAALTGCACRCSQLPIQGLDLACQAVAWSRWAYLNPKDLWRKVSVTLHTLHRQVLVLLLMIFAFSRTQSEMSSRTQREVRTKHFGVLLPVLHPLVPVLARPRIFRPTGVPSFPMRSLSSFSRLMPMSSCLQPSAWSWLLYHPRRQPLSPLA